MIDLFRSLLGGSTSVAPAPKPKLAVDFRAVSLQPAIACQAAGRVGVDKRYLVREAPRLPLAGCATPERCTCKYRKHADRRFEDRRLLGGTHNAAWYVGNERRLRRSRRATLN